MRNLLNFLIKYNSWFVFLFYLALSCVILVRDNLYQQSVYLTSANAVSSGINGVTSEVSGYFQLRDINETLQRRNAYLENEVLNLREQLAGKAAGDVADTLHGVPRFGYVTANVLNNSVSHPKNYFTINRGSDAGIKPGMGVVDQNGVVGIVDVVGRKTARVISVLNVTQHFSVKLKDTDYVGMLTWHGGSPDVTYVEDIGRHARFHVGDTVVTSGNSTTFPPGIPVGTVVSRVRGSDDNFFTLKVRPASNFGKLTSVRIIKDEYKAELDSLAVTDNDISE